MNNPLASILLSDPRAIAEADVDYLVIGSGTTGVTTAIELAGRGLRVAILEAGPLVLTEHVGSGPFANREDIVPGIHDLVRYRTTWTLADNEASARLGQVETNNNAWSVVGGRTLFWGGCTPRFLDSDFEMWPFGAQEMQPWYAAAERLIGVSGAGTESSLPPLTDHEPQRHLMNRLDASGIHATTAPLGVDTGPVSGEHLSRGFDSSVSRLLRCHLFGKVEAGARLSLAAETEVLKLVVDGPVVRAVTVRDHARGEVFDIPVRHVVLAGGAVQSVRLAVASGLGESDPMIGRFMGDHLFRQAVFKLPEPIGEKALYIFLPSTPERPFHAQMQGMFPETWYSPLHATVWLDGSPEGQYILFYCFGVSKAEWGGHLALTDTSSDKPMRDYCMVVDRSMGDLETLAAMSDFTTKVAEAMGAELVRTEEHVAGCALHEFGGLRMGTDPASSVTNPDGRFWRVNNLNCVDAAIWPHQGSANSYLTLTAMALRNAARMVSEGGLSEVQAAQ